MSRRAVLLVALISLALLATAVAPWTLTSGGLAAAVGKQLRQAYGLDLVVRGRSTIAFLPVPRVKFEDVTLKLADTGTVVEGGILRGELRVESLFLGRPEIAEVSLSGSRIAIAPEGWGVPAWRRLMAILRQQTDPKTAAGPHLRRIVLSGVAIERAPAETEEGDLQDVNLFVDWPSADAAADITGSFLWRGERVEIVRAHVQPVALALDKAAPFALTLDAPVGRVTLSGEARTGDDPRAQGHSLVEIRSPREVARWSGLDLPLGPLMQALAVEGGFTAARHRLDWPSVRLTLGTDRLDGTLTIRFDTDRPLIAGTLAADQLNLSDFFMPFLQARTPAGYWSSEPLGLVGVTGGDLDLRVSATSARVGRLRLDDMAASVLVRPGRVEASLGRATLNRGVVKGRLGLSTVAEGTDLKMQASFDKVDMAGLLADLGQPRWLAGQAQGQAVLEGAGLNAADLVRKMHGRTAISLQQGELIGVALIDVLRRVEKRPLAASLEWRGGRTPFDQAHLQLAFDGGAGEIMEGALTAPGMRTGLQGRVSLVERTLNVKAQVEAPSPASSSPAFIFDVTGGWDDPAVIPDAQALIQRSRAARPLLGVPPGGSTSRGASALPPGNP